MHYYQFNIGDYIKQTLHLTPEEDLCYRRLLDMYYDSEKPIPTDIPWVSRRLRMGCEIVESILNEFFELTENGYANKRADAEIADYHRYIQKQQANGKLGGRPSKTQQKPTANPDQTQAKPKKSLNNNQQPLTTISIKEKDKKEIKPEDVTDETWKDFVQHRKAKKAAITNSAINGIRKEAEKAEIKLEDALIECCQRGWIGFKAEWIKKEKQELDWDSWDFTEQQSDLPKLRRLT